jgi:hypothetical protein
MARPHDQQCTSAVAARASRNGSRNRPASAVGFGNRSIGGGKTIPPTREAFRLGMVTIGHWNGSTMDHELLFWDSQDFMKQLGPAK